MAVRLKQATEVYRTEMVVFGAWLKECCECKPTSEQSAKAHTAGDGVPRSDRSERTYSLLLLWLWEYTDEFGKHRVTRYRLNRGWGARALRRVRKAGRVVARVVSTAREYKRLAEAH